jgi:phage gp45-like
MSGLVQWLYTAMVTAVARGKVVMSWPGRRGLLQVQILSGEVKDRIEHLLPYGRSASPAAGDALLLTVGGSRDQVVCVAVDNPALRIARLAPGEFGDSDGFSVIVFKNDSLRILSVRKIAIQSDELLDLRAPAINLGALGEAGYVLLDERAIDVFNNHTHAGGAPPDQQLAVGDHTTTAVKGS